MEIVSGPLSRGSYLSAIGQIVELFHDSGVKEVLVVYGFGCECPEEQLYIEVLVPTARLQSFIRKSEENGYYMLGQDDLHIREPDGRSEVCLCHESDIHLVTDDRSLFDRLKAVWITSGDRGVYEKQGNQWKGVESN